MSLLETRAGAFTGWTLKHSTYLRSAFSFSFKHFCFEFSFEQEFFWGQPYSNSPDIKRRKTNQKEKNKTQKSIDLVTPRILNCSSNNQSSSRTTTCDYYWPRVPVHFLYLSFFLFLCVYKKSRKQMFTLTITL